MTEIPEPPPDSLPFLPRVAVVDPNARTRNETVTQLLEYAFEVKAFERGEAFLDYVESGHRLDAALLDLKVDDIHPWGLLRRLRTPSGPEGPRRFPVIVTSELLSQEVASEISSGLGAEGFLRRPTTSSELYEAVQGVLYARPAVNKRRHLVLGVASDEELVGSLTGAGFDCLLLTEPGQAALRVSTYNPDVILINENLIDLLPRDVLVTSGATLLLLTPHPESDPASLRKNLWLSGPVRWPDECGAFLAALERCHRAHALWRLHHTPRETGSDFEADEETLRLLLDHIPDLALLLDEHGTIMRLNSAALKAFGANESQLLGSIASHHVAAADYEPLPLMPGWNAQRSQREFEVVCTRFNGSTFEATARLSRLNHHGRNAILLFLRDRSVEQLAREAVRVSEAKLKIIAENTSDWEFWRSPHGHFLYSSTACEKICGYAHREFEMQPDFLASITLPCDHDKLPETEEAEQPDEVVERSFRIVTREGEIRWIHYLSRPIYDDQSNLLGRRGNIRDVTDQHQAAQEREALGAAVEQSREAIGISNLSGLMQFANPAFYTLLDGLTKGRRQPPLLRGRWKAIREVLERGETLSESLTRKDLRDQHRDLQFTLSPLRDGTGGVRQVLWLIRDVTAETELRERLEVAQRLDSLGNLAGGLAHDFNNLLASILGHASLLTSHSGQSQEVAQAASVITTASKRASELTQKLLGFARGGKQTHETFSLHGVLEEAVTLLGSNIPRGTSLAWKLDAEHPWIDGDPSQISQVLINLSINAAQSLDKVESSITLQSFNRPAGSGGGEEVVVQIRDNGCGMNRATLQRVFEPFYTTKASGSGLGLSMVYGIVGNHGGTVTVESEPGVGTVFHLCFPVSKQRPELVVPVPLPVCPAEPRRESILVVDDEDMVRLTLCRMLERMKFQVVSCASGEAAVEYYRSHHSDVGFVVLDMQMPQMDGLECFQALQTINSEVRAVVATGFCHPEMALTARELGVLQVVSKPFDFQQLGRLLDSHLQRPAKEPV